MIAKRPSIFIYANGESAEILREICAGIEEEGVFFEIFQKSDHDLNVLAWKAAQDSMMGSGIGINQTGAALQIRGLPVRKNICELEHASKEAYRILGINSARIVKKMPLK